VEVNPYISVLGGTTLHATNGKVAGLVSGGISADLSLVGELFK
jgi:hypothetical protein